MQVENYDYNTDCSFVSIILKNPSVFEIICMSLHRFLGFDFFDGTQRDSFSVIYSTKRTS